MSAGALDTPVTTRRRMVVALGASLVATMLAPAPLVSRRRQLEDQVADLKTRRAAMEPDAYLAALERLLVDLARVSRDLRRRMAPS